jgi:hypothetical protein
MSARTLLVLSALAILFAAVPLGRFARAQDDEEEEATPAEATPAEPAEPAGPPMASGRTEVTAVVGPRGMTFELRSHAQVFIPAGLPTGAGRSITFAEVRGRIDNATVAPGFNRLGTLMSFNGALNATSNPVVVSIRQPSNPLRDDRRVVLAMEQPSICREGLTPLEGAGGLCSGWELLDARYDEGDRRLSASMTTPGGHRLMFGWVPRTSE